MSIFPASRGESGLGRGPIDHQLGTLQMRTGSTAGARALPAGMVTAGEAETVRTVEEVFDVFLPDCAGPEPSGLQTLCAYREEHQ